MTNQPIEELAREASLSDDETLARLGTAVIGLQEEDDDELLDLREEVKDLERELSAIEARMDEIRKLAID